MAASRETMVLGGLAAALFGLMLVLRSPSEAAASGIGFLALLPFAKRAAHAIRPPRWPWPAVPLAHLPIGLLVALGQAAVAVAVNRALGEATSSLLAEVRIALVCYALVVAAMLSVRRR